jgi:hypothetical protein
MTVGWAQHSAFMLRPSPFPMLLSLGMALVAVKIALTTAYPVP